EGTLVDATIIEAPRGQTREDGLTHTKDPGATYTLVTDRAPVWGDFYTKDGVAGGLGANTAWNTGFGTDAAADATDFTNWVATPDTVSAVPVPAAAWMGLVTMGIAGLSGVARRRTAKA
ncbi:MAG: VPLPA-CTERM sorting domain-containing protein, partial [Planctomycetota bacterium]|nr:VPLPA-CTERM sorting domain-containing protein [Planctomycetota bacterium]